MTAAADTEASHGRRPLIDRDRERVEAAQEEHLVPAYRFTGRGDKREPVQQPGEGHRPFEPG